MLKSVPFFGLIITVAALAAVFTSAARAQPPSGIAARFDAAFSLCRAQEASGEITAELQETCDALIRARFDRETDRVISLLTEFERLIAVDEVILEPIVVSFDLPEGVEFSPVLLRAKEDVVYVDQNEADHLDLFFELLARADPALVVFRPRPFNPVTDQSQRPLFGPPPGFADWHAEAQSLASILEDLDTMTLGAPGVSTTRPDWMIWAWCVSRAFPDHPLVVDGIPEIDDELVKILSESDTVLFSLVSTPEQPRTSSDLLMALYRTSFLGRRTTGLIFGGEIPENEVVVQAVRSLNAPVRTSGYRSGKVVLFSDGERMIAVNQSGMTARADVIAATQAFDDATATIVFIRDDGDIEVFERTGKFPLALPLLPGGVSFITLKPAEN